MKHSSTALRASWPFLTLAVLLWVGYRGLGGTGFASEDFLILRYLHPQTLGSVFLSELRGPWLGLSFVNFYRPVSTLLLAVELKLWGLDATALHWSHLVVHGANTVLVGAIARRLTQSSTAVPLALSALFAISPLHPSAVAFIGSYATVFGCFFVLVTLAAFLRFRETGERWAYGLSLASFVLALGAYEAAVVLPAALLAESLIRDSGTKHWKRRVVSLLPFMTLAAAYFVLRRAVLGVFVGGYSSFQDRFFREVAGRAVEGLRSLPQLVLPRLHAPLSERLAVALGSALVVGVLLFFIRRRSSPLASTAALGLVWAAVFQAPFFFVSVVPATGRFWYLPTFAATLSILAVSWGCVEGLRRFRRLGRVLWIACVVAALGHHFLALRSDLELTLEADREIRDIREALESRKTSRPGQPWLVTGTPDFARGDDGLPVAKIFQYGLHEASQPPFGKSSGWVYPVPADVHPLQLRRIGRAIDAEILRWDRDRRQLVAVSSASAATALEGEPSIHLGAVSGLWDPVEFRCGECDRVRLALLTSGPPYRSPWQEVTGGGGSVEMPRAFLESMALHHGGQVLGWLEDRGEKGQPPATSDVFYLPLSRFGSSP